MLSHLPRQASPDQTVACSLEFAAKEGAVCRVFSQFVACQVGVEEQVVGISGEEDMRGAEKWPLELSSLYRVLRRAAPGGRIHGRRRIHSEWVGLLCLSGQTQTSGGKRI